jgi:hypothetical protein
METVVWNPSTNGHFPYLIIESTHSPENNGWYTEVVESDGKTVHVTRVFRERYAAKCAARRWIDLN